MAKSTAGILALTDDKQIVGRETEAIVQCLRNSIVSACVAGLVIEDKVARERASGGPTPRAFPAESETALPRRLAPAERFPWDAASRAASPWPPATRMAPNSPPASVASSPRARSLGRREPIPSTIELSKRREAAPPRRANRAPIGGAAVGTPFSKRATQLGKVDRAESVRPSCRLLRRSSIHPKAAA